MAEPQTEPPRSTERLLLIMNALSRASTHGLRLVDIMEATGLGKGTAHRLVNGLTEQGLIDFEQESGRFFIGMRVLAWASSARNRFSLARLAEPSLARIARTTGDTIYLVARSGDHAVCVDSWEGSFPIKVLTFAIGDRRPLGIGAGSLAMLACLPDQEVERVLGQQAKERSEYAIGEPVLREMLSRTRRNGYAYNDIHVFRNMDNVTGMAAVAVAIRRPDGMPVAAIHLTTITSRLQEPRRSEIVIMLTEECKTLQNSLQPVLETQFAPNSARFS
jgi:DNA-binding IclR family transcriptional regulator